MSQLGLSLKREFNIGFSVVIFSPIVLVSWWVAWFDLEASRFCCQTQQGRHVGPFKIFKPWTTIRATEGTTVTSASDARVVRVGRALCRYKMVKILHLWNVLRDEISLVGSRPGVPDYLDRIDVADRCFLSLRPGLTRPASIKYQNEEELIAVQSEPRHYNDTILRPNRVRAGLDSWSFIVNRRGIMMTVQA